MPQGKGSLWVAATALLLLAAAGATTARPQQPLRVEAAWGHLFRRPAQPPAPADNPLTPAKVALGARLFSDPRLSGGGERSCASCHRPERSMTDGRRRARGLTGASLARNTPSLWNLAWSEASISGTGARPRWKPRSACRSLPPTRWLGIGPAFWRGSTPIWISWRRSRRLLPSQRRFQKKTWPRPLPATCARSSLLPRASMPGSRETAMRSRPTRCAGFAFSPARPGACCAMWAGASPTIASTTSACRARMPGGVRWPAAHRGYRPSRPRACASWHIPRPTCTTARGRRWPRSWRTTPTTFRKRPSLAPSLRRLHLTGAERADLIAFLGTLSSAGSPARPKPAGHP